MDNYSYITLREKPDLKETAANWFHGKFSVPTEAYLKCMEEGILRTFVEAGCAVSAPTCGPCLGGHMGVMAAGERAVATTNRNFVGRMGHTQSEVILASPAVAAASALAGCIADPRGL